LSLKSTKREGIYVISPLERLNPKSEAVEKSFFKQTIHQLKRPNKRRKFQAAMGETRNVFTKSKGKYISQLAAYKNKKEQQKKSY
jgi:hypothetical protein